MRIILLCLVIIFGCNNNESDNIHSYRMPKPKNTELFSWNIPGNWISTNTTQFSQANYLIPSSRGSADISISYFAGNAGGVKANVNRWRRQLNLEPQSLDQMKKSILIRSSALGDYKIIKIINIIILILSL